MDIHETACSHGPLRPGSSQEAANFIVVVPQLPQPGGDIWHQHADAVQQIVRQVQTEYRGDPNRTYLTGFSYGGNGVFDVASGQQAFWAALWPVDPTKLWSSNPQRPIWLWYGTDTLQQNQTTVDKLSLQSAPANGIPAGDSFYTNTGLCHVPTATSAYADSRVYKWLANTALLKVA
jgi:predicted peptidase